MIEPMPRANAFVEVTLTAAASPTLAAALRAMAEAVAMLEDVRVTWVNALSPTDPVLVDPAALKATKAAPLAEIKNAPGLVADEPAASGT